MVSRSSISLWSICLICRYCVGLLQHSKALMKFSAIDGNNHRAFGTPGYNGEHSHSPSQLTFEAHPHSNSFRRLRRALGQVVRLRRLSPDRHLPRLLRPRPRPHRCRPGLPRGSRRSCTILRHDWPGGHHWLPLRRCEPWLRCR